MTEKNLCLADTLIPWYEANRRILPWREDATPYHVWLSEIMLQQTRVEAVRAYYERFLTEIPDIAHLAEAEEDVLLKLWEGLGYYSRVRNLQKAAKIVMQDLGGRMPDTVEGLLALPGIGTYTAGAIASIAFHKKAALVDGNVLRVMARLRADTRDTAEEKTKREVLTEIGSSYLPAEDALCGTFNQALMELGALVCVPNGAPLCTDCPLNGLCAAHLAEKETDYPVKRAKKKRRIEKRTVLLFCDRTRIVLRKRPDKGLLAGLYEYPTLTGHLPERDLRSLLSEKTPQALRIRKLPDAKHIFTHVEWRMKGYLIYMEEMEEETATAPENVILADRISLTDTYAIPSAFKVYTEIAKNLLASYDF